MQVQLGRHRTADGGGLLWSSLNVTESIRRDALRFPLHSEAMPWQADLDVMQSPGLVQSGPFHLRAAEGAAVSTDPR